MTLRRRDDKRSRGYMLAELLVVTVIIGLVLGGILIVVTDSGQNAWLKGHAEWVGQTESQRVVDRLTQDLGTASAATVNCAGAPNTLLIGGGANMIQYDYTPPAGVGNGVLSRTQGGTTVVLADHLTNFTLPMCVNGLIRIQVTSQGRAGRGWTVPQTVSTSIWVQSP